MRAFVDEFCSCIVSQWKCVYVRAGVSKCVDVKSLNINLYLSKQQKRERSRTGAEKQVRNRVEERRRGKEREMESTDVKLHESFAPPTF